MKTRPTIKEIIELTSTFASAMLQAISLLAENKMIGVIGLVPSVINCLYQTDLSELSTDSSR